MVGVEVGDLGRDHVRHVVEIGLTAADGLWLSGPAPDSHTETAAVGQALAMRHRLSAVPSSGAWTAKAPTAVELPAMASSLPLCTLRIL